MATAEAMKYKDKGNDEFKKGNMAQAIEFYTYATEMDPNNPIFFTNRSAAYAHMQKWDKSLRDADKAIKLNSSWEKGYWRKGNAHFELGQFDEATAAYKTACDLEPSNQTSKELYQKSKKATLKGKSEGEILKMQGNEEFKKGNIEQAIKLYTSALAECEDDEKGKLVKADIYCNRAACYHQLYDPKKTAEDCTSALKVNPNHVKALIRRAQALESLEKYEDALKDFDAALLHARESDVAVKGASRIRAALKKIQKDKKGGS